MKPLLISTILMCLFGCSNKPAMKSIGVPAAGYVPDEKTAIAVAVAIWNAQYGEKEIAAQKPYEAKLDAGIWHVMGSLPPEVLGGVANAEISKADGRIISVWHTQ
jgi:hypothetical protein